MLFEYRQIWQIIKNVGQSQTFESAKEVNKKVMSTSLDST